MAEFASRYWAFRSPTIDAPVNDRLMLLSKRLFNLLDHVPARLTAFGFAVVGNFEEAITCWRRDAGLWKFANEGIILSAAAGAVGVRLGGASAPGGRNPRDAVRVPAPNPKRSQPTARRPASAPEFGHLRSVVGLVWRSVVLWMLLLGALVARQSDRLKRGTVRPELVEACPELRVWEAFHDREVRCDSELSRLRCAIA